MSREKKVFYGVRLEKQPLEMLKMIAEVEYETTSCMIRRAIVDFITEWHTKKKPILIEGRKGYEEVMKILDDIKTTRQKSDDGYLSGEVRW